MQCHCQIITPHLLSLKNKSMMGGAVKFKTAQFFKMPPNKLTLTKVEKIPYFLKMVAFDTLNGSTSSPSNKRKNNTKQNKTKLHKAKKKRKKKNNNPYSLFCWSRMLTVIYSTAPPPSTHIYSWLQQSPQFHCTLL